MSDEKRTSEAVPDPDPNRTPEQRRVCNAIRERHGLQPYEEAVVVMRGPFVPNTELIRESFEKYQRTPEAWITPADREAAEELYGGCLYITNQHKEHFIVQAMAAFARARSPRPDNPRPVDLGQVRLEERIATVDRICTWLRDEHGSTVAAEAVFQRFRPRREDAIECNELGRDEPGHGAIGAGGGDEEGHVHPDVLAAQSPEVQAQYAQRFACPSCGANEEVEMYLASQRRGEGGR